MAYDPGVDLPVDGGMGPPLPSQQAPDAVSLNYLQNQVLGYDQSAPPNQQIQVPGGLIFNPTPLPYVPPSQPTSSYGYTGGTGGMTAYEAATVADTKAKLQEQQREFDAKQQQDLAIFQQQQHTEEEKLQFARDQENNKVQFQYAQLAQTQQQFEQTLGWDKTKFYTQFGLDVTKEQDAAIQSYRDALMKEQGSPQDMVSYLYNIRGYQAPSGGVPTAMPLPPSVLAAYQAQGLPLPQAFQGGQQGQYPFLGTLPQGFGGGAGNIGQPQQQQLPGGISPGMALNQPLSAAQQYAQAGQQMANQFAPGAPTSITPSSYVPLGTSQQMPPTIQYPSGSQGGQLTQGLPGRAQPNVASAPPAGQTAPPMGTNQPFNVWNYLPPQLRSFFTPSQSTTPNFPGTNVPSQPSAIIPSAQMYNQLLPSEQGALQSFQSQQLGIMPADMKSLMEQNAPTATTNLTPTGYS